LEASFRFKRMEDGRWETEDGRLKMEDGRWKTEDGRQKTEDRMQSHSPEASGPSISFKDGRRKAPVPAS
jgi:hypothetical protein